MVTESQSTGMTPRIKWRLVGLFGALTMAVGLAIVVIITSWSMSHWFTFGLLVIALIALGFALWQYNQLRFESDTNE